MLQLRLPLARAGLVSALILGFTSFAAGADEPRVVPLGPAYSRTGVNTVIFRSDPITSHGDVQYAAWYDGDARVVLAKRKLGDVRWEVRRTDLTGNVKDAHNSISLGVDGNGLLHVSWDHHNHPLRYVQAKEPGSLELTAKLPMTGKLEARVCYPEFFRLADGDLLFMYRDGGSGNGQTLLNRFDHKAGTWSIVQHPLIDGRPKNNAYTNRVVLGPDGVWHLSWCWRETPDVVSNHDICYARSADQGKTWTKSTGEAYRLPITEAQAEKAVEIPENSYLINQTTMTVDAQGVPIISTYWKPAGAAAVQVHAIRLEAGKWRVYPVTQRKAEERVFVTGGGTRRKALSRPSIAAHPTDGRIFVLLRDDQQEGRLIAYWCDGKDLTKWDSRPLTQESLDAFEPTYDRNLWARSGVFHIYLQKAGQGDGEKAVDMAAQPASVLEWKP